MPPSATAVLFGIVSLILGLERVVFKCHVKKLVGRGNQLDSEILQYYEIPCYVFNIFGWCTGSRLVHNSPLSISQGGSGRVCSHSSLDLGLAKWRNNEKWHWLWENLRHDPDISIYMNAPEEVKLWIGLLGLTGAVVVPIGRLCMILSS